MNNSPSCFLLAIVTSTSVLRIDSRACSKLCLRVRETDDVLNKLNSVESTSNGSLVRFGLLGLRYLEPMPARDEKRK